SEFVAFRTQSLRPGVKRLRNDSSTGSAERPDQRAAGDHERGTDQQVPTDQLRPAQEEHGEEDGEEGLRRDERADDRDARAVEGLEEKGVRRAPEDAGEDEGRPFAPDVGEDATA